MSTFPPRLRFPQKPNGASTDFSVRSTPFFNFIDFTCEGHRFTTIVNDPSDLVEGEVYYFHGAHMIIPKYFSKVDVSEKGEVLNKGNREIGIEINRFFALCMRDPSQFSEIWNGKKTFDKGTYACAFGSNNIIARGGQNIINNAHQLFFNFHNHYYTPIILSNGTVCYYAFEATETIADWVSAFSSGEEFQISLHFI